MPVGRRWATKSQVAQYLATSISTVDRMVERGELTAYPVGKRLIRFDLNEVDATVTAGSEAN
ncbi:hypothetical protein B1R94_02215 [Mycolicibacterium litorale]|nr:hypothetical protein B1R94_02215 [Mycolicibacterium litorale]